MLLGLAATAAGFGKVGTCDILRQSCPECGICKPAYQGKPKPLHNKVYLGCSAGDLV